MLDAAKRVAQDSAIRTDGASKKHFPTETWDPMGESRGESAFVFRVNGKSTLATVLECLGTKSVVAREYVDAGGPNLFYNVGWDSVAAIINDLVSVGALPLVVNAYFSTGSPHWYKNRARHEALVDGWREACLEAGAVWGGGESPTLSGLVDPRDIEIAGSAVGFVPQKPDVEGNPEPILGKHLKSGDEIVFVESNGLHANGASLVRSLTQADKSVYRRSLSDGREFGEAVLDKSYMYAGLVSAMHEAEVDVTYLSHITGHGLRKVMRADKDLTYRITKLLPVPPVLAAIAEWSGLDDETAYGTLNMGVGYAVYCAKGHGQRVVDLAKGLDLNAVVAGHVEKGPRQVLIDPLDVSFKADQLLLRATDAKKRSKR